MGAIVTYADRNATTSTGQDGVVSGTVNGEPLCDDDGNVIHIPVWSERDNDREPTTVLVAVQNVLGIKL